MARLLFLVHRTPYPPNKGDKIRSWHILQHLAARHEIYLGYFEDSAEDMVHRPFLADQAKALRVTHVSPLGQKILSLKGLLTGEPQSVSAYPKKELRAFVNSLIQAQKIDAIFLFSGITACLLPPDLSIPVILDMVDVDSAKWQSYAQTAAWPMSALYRREADTLSAFEASIAKRSTVTFFVSDAEAHLFRSRTGLSPEKVMALSNGVDLDAFCPPDPKHQNADTHPSLLFTGAMTYPPNVEAVTFFADRVLPTLQSQFPGLEFVIAGSPVAASVKLLGTRPGIRVTGFVDDMRDELRGATLAVAPLFTARGIQNKVLEAMAMGLPTITTPEAAEGIWPLTHAVEQDAPVMLASDADGMIKACQDLLQDEPARASLGLQARAYVEKYFAWDANLAILDRVMAELGLIP